MPELTDAGQRVDSLLESQGRSKTWAAQKVGVTRQHLHRVMTGRADLKPAQWQQLAAALGVTRGYLLGEEEQGQWEPETVVPEDGPTSEGIELEDYVRSFDRIVRTLRTLPGDRLSIPLKLAILDGVRENAEMIGAQLPKEFFEIRKQVLNGEL